MEPFRSPDKIKESFKSARKFQNIARFRVRTYCVSFCATVEIRSRCFKFDSPWHVYVWIVCFIYFFKIPKKFCFHLFSNTPNQRRQSDKRLPNTKSIKLLDDLDIFGKKKKKPDTNSRSGRSWKFFRRLWCNPDKSTCLPLQVRRSLCPDKKWPHMAL